MNQISLTFNPTRRTTYPVQSLRKTQRTLDI